MLPICERILVRDKIVFAMSDPTTIYTIGHSNVLASKITGLLKPYGIQVLIDVRSSPYSQRSPQFNRDELEEFLREYGIEYRFAGEFLGGRPNDPTCYKNRQVPKEDTDYLHLVDYPTVMTKDWFLRGLNRLIEIAQNQRVAIMCSEENPSRCHRHHLVGKALMQRGVVVRHIRNDGNMVKAEQIPDLSNDPPAEQPELL